MLHSRTFRSIIILLVALAFASTAYALAAGNTFSDATNQAGDGANTISGYIVSNVKYTLDTSNPANITNVTFTLNASATTVKVSLVTSAALQSCTPDTGLNNWTCSITGVSATAADSLRVSASQ